MNWLLSSVTVPTQQKWMISKLYSSPHFTDKIKQFITIWNLVCFYNYTGITSNMTIFKF